MKSDERSDPVSLIIKACRRNEDEAKRIYHLLAEKRQHQLELDNQTSVVLTEEQLGDFTKRFSSEIEPLYWESKRLKH